MLSYILEEPRRHQLSKKLGKDRLLKGNRKQRAGVGLAREERASCRDSTKDVPNKRGAHSIVIAGPYTNEQGERITRLCRPDGSEFIVRVPEFGMDRSTFGKHWGRDWIEEDSTKSREGLDRLLNDVVR